MSQFKRLIILLADGARPDVMNELLSSDELPNIKKYLVNEGTQISAVTAFPSTTGPAYMPFLTGCLPATCNVPGIRWMDKVRQSKSLFHFNRHRSYVGLETYLIGHDMRRDLPTLFDLLPNSYNIFNSVNKGVSFRGNRTSLSRIWYWYYAHLTDRWSFVDKAAVKKMKELLHRDFGMIFVILPGIDEYSHIAHYKHRATIDSYKLLDSAVGEAFRGLEEGGRASDTLFWLVSDHGLSVTHTHCCVNTFLEGRGIKTLYYPKIFRKGCVAANMVSGNSMTHIYFKHDYGWPHPMYYADIEKKYPNLLGDLLNERGVDVLACRYDTKNILVKTKRGSAKIELEGDKIFYRVEGGDPFGYDFSKGELSADESLSLTTGSNYPDAIYQLAHLFTSHRSGDVVLSATKGYDLRDKYEVHEHKGSHGSLHREHMVVPLFCNARVESKNVRTVDVFPTVLKLLGYPIPVNIDGKSLV